MEAVGAALKTWREEAKLRQEDVELELGMDAGTVSRWERGKNVPKLENLARFVRLVQGSGDVVMDLLADETATAEDGKQRALAWLYRETEQETNDIVRAAQSDPLRVLEIIRRDLDQLERGLHSGQPPYPSDQS